MIRSGQISAFFLFDVADSLDLTGLAGLLNVQTEPARLAPKPALPGYVQYQVTPIQIEGDAMGAGDVAGFRVRFKLFDYGVISVLLTRPFAGSWDDLIGLAHSLTSDVALESGAERLCRSVVDRIRPALERPRDRFLSEDYWVFSVTELEHPLTADALLAESGHEIAQLLRAEREPLSAQERDEVLRHRLSYLENDLVVPTWNTALVYDTHAGIRAALEIFEYANSQLLQFRYYDELLDKRLAEVYHELETRKTYWRWWPQRYTRAARQVHGFLIDVNQLTDRTENALKLVGDVFAARLLAMTHSRLGFPAWRDSVQEKLKTLDEIYHFAVDQTGMSRGHLLELAIIAILVFELVLFFLGIMR